MDFPHKLGICERLFGRRIAKHGICWAKTGAGIPWKLDLANPTHRWIVYGKYEGSPFLSWAKTFLPSDGIVIDAGANIGQMLLYLAQCVPKGRVLAFEPGKEQADWLEECLQVHSDLPVEVLRYGLGASRVKSCLCKPGPEYIHGAWSQISETEGEPIEIVRLEEELNARSIESVHLWKLDVEGYELAALKGAQRLLRNQRFEALYIELAGENRH
ncbi:MAG: FkbM family methyltransferase, partial [Gammaproteobacteria bacterium]